MEWYLKVLRQYADFTGRARRMEYWMFALINFIIVLVLNVLDGALRIGVLGLLYSLAVLLPSLAVSVRRLHDIGRTGWWLLLVLIPVIGWIVLIVFHALEGDREPNAYGPDPKTIAGPTTAPSY